MSIPVPCPECGAAVPPRCPICPGCGLDDPLEPGAAIKVAAAQRLGLDPNSVRLSVRPVDAPRASAYATITLGARREPTDWRGSLEEVRLTYCMALGLDPDDVSVIDITTMADPVRRFSLARR